MIPCDARCEVLRSLNATRSSLDRQTGSGDRCARTARIGIENLVSYENTLGRIRLPNISILHIGGHRYRVSNELHLRILGMDGDRHGQNDACRDEAR
jgi:hypothetical protein